jgi:predicted nucleotidyltransferase
MKTITPAIDRAKEYSERKLVSLREQIAGRVPEGEIVLTCGSYARREASIESDIDFFVITQAASPAGGFVAASLPWFEELRAVIGEVVPIEPAAGAVINVSDQEGFRGVGSVQRQARRWQAARRWA